ncbi:MAG: phage capsid family protein [Caulobacteraceae bacterium]
MAEVTLATASERQVWQTNYVREYVRDSRFMPYMSNADINKGGIILTKFQHEEEAFRTINVPFIGRLVSAGVTGGQVLDGAEEELTNYNCPITIDWRRNGVRVPKSAQFRTEINLLNAAKDNLQVWESEKLRDDIIKSLASVVVDANGTVVNFDTATAAQKNTWTGANSDRILFGNSKSLFNATFSTGAAAVTAAMTISTATVSLAKRIAKAANPRIRPFRVEATQAREYYVAFHGARTFRDLKLDTNMVDANTQARGREGTMMDKNPLFQDGDLIYDGVIHREVPEIDDYCATAGFNAIGASGADVRPIFLCGAASVGIAWGQMPTPRTDVIKDYGFRPGVAIEELLGVKKINFNSVQNGVVTVLAGAASD